MRPGLSVCMLARDEVDELERALASVDFADELVIVVDDRSRDGTERLARRIADRVEVRPYAGDVAQKRHATSLAEHDWVMILDPDEVVPEALAAEIVSALEVGVGDVDAFEVNRATYHLGRWIRHGDFYPDYTLRLFRRSKARFEGEDPHGRVVVSGRVARLNAPLHHFSYRDLSDQIERIQFFSDQAAAAMQARGRRVRLSDLVLRPPARFLRAYLLKQGFRDGLPGLIIAAATAFHVFLKYAKLWEREQAG